jgi:hypothetical protein
MKNPQILKIETLTGDWCDNDIAMLHVCFKLLTDCVETENLLNGHIDWTSTEEMQKIKIEIETLYIWWLERKNKENDLDSEQYNEDNEMLIRLIKIRQHLWT